MTRQVDSDSVTLSENESYNSRLTWDTSDTESGEYTVTVQGKNDSYSFTTEINAESGVSRWTFDDSDTSGGIAIDSWSSNDGTINGATAGVTGANQTYTTNEAYSFDGTDDFIGSLSSPEAISSGSSSFSVSFWFNPDSGFDTSDAPNSSRREIIGRAGSNSDNFAIFTRELNFNPKVEFYIDTGTGTFLNSSTAITSDTWFFITVVFNSGEMDIYINGSIDSQASSSSSSLASSTNPLRIGWGGVSYTDFYLGQLDDVRIYDKALTSQEVSNLYNTGFIQ